MEPGTPDAGASIESDLATTYKLIDLYIRQKTDLFLQHYVFEPFDFLGRKLMYLSVVMALLAAGTLILAAGVILLIATVVPLWAALLITGVAAFLIAGLIAWLFFHQQCVLQTPTAREMMNRGQT